MVIVVIAYWRTIIIVFHSWLAQTDPADVARVESRTFVVTPTRREAIPNRKDGVSGQLGNWMSPDELHKVIQDRFPSCMKGNHPWHNWHN